MRIPYEAIKINFMCLYLGADGLSIPGGNSIGINYIKGECGYKSPN